jgi:rRNA maturation endonuclease Nob1
LTFRQSSYILKVTNEKELIGMDEFVYICEDCLEIHEDETDICESCGGKCNSVFKRDIGIYTGLEEEDEEEE